MKFLALNSSIKRVITWLSLYSSCFPCSVYNLSVYMVNVTLLFHWVSTGKDFQGKKLKVSMARRKPMMGMMRGGMPMRGDRGGMMGRGGNEIVTNKLPET